MNKAIRGQKGIWISLLIFILSVNVLSGCSSITKAKANPPTVKEISEKVKQVVDTSALKTGNYVNLKKMYGITKGEIEEFALYRAPSNIKADEIAIIKVKDPNQVDAIKEKLLKRADKQAASFKDYLPDEYYLIEKKVVKVQDNYILFAVSKDAAKISSTFDECFK